MASVNMGEGYFKDEKGRTYKADKSTKYKRVYQDSNYLGQGMWKDNKDRLYKADKSTGWQRQYNVSKNKGNSYTQIGDNQYEQANGGIFSYETGLYKENGIEKYGQHRVYNDPRKKLEDDINKTYDSQLADYRMKRDKARKEVEGQKKQVGQQFYEQKNAADVVSKQNAQKLREMMAANGLTKTGENVSASIAQGNTRQNALNTLSKEESSQQGQLDQRITEIMDPAQEKSIEAARSEALTQGKQWAEQQFQQQKQNWQNQQFQNMQFAWQQQQANIQQGNWQKQFDATNNQWTQQFNANNSQWNKQFDAQNSQWQKQFDSSNTQFNQTLAFQKQQWKEQNATNKSQWQAEQDWRKYTYNNMSASEKAQLDWNKKQFGDEMAWRQYELNYNGNIAMSQAQAQASAYAGMSGDSSGFLG
ncbi:hypothetical protein CPT_Pascal17 [Bacillus phage Pascal]|uniref:Uncharacterized protein n=1 Tax=Bacillus phage Pascal TaxID=1540092 RepID=A0A0A0RNQ2_9CAUD|nr:hypothetical protein CPT_Pascal17 [Bacillus phage Pascal]AIW03652.1 hypothetical protein CPT_Pascal17 [Bacillus phage Pascal]